jgi:putative sigma-54 modulation protein
MQVTITRRNAALSESLKLYIESRLSGLSRYHTKIMDAHVVMDKEGKDEFVEITLRVAGRSLFSKDSSTNLRAAVDSCVEKLNKQVIKAKDKYRRKSLTAVESVLSGKVIVEGATGVEPAESDQPILTFENEETDEGSEERTGT